MKTTVAKYLQGISHKFARETSTEYSYRTEFEEFIKQVFEKLGVTTIDHDAKSTDGNKPDFAIINNQIPILYIETKDVGVSLDKIEKSEQMARYFGYANLVLTDYLEFRFYRNGIPYGEPIKIADHDKKNRTITGYEEKYEQLFRRLIDFTQSHKEPIKSGEHLAKIMGGKAQRIRDNIREFLKDESANTNETIKVYETIKKLLVHDLNLNQFADMYAQTIVYGLFVARFYDDSQESFSRQEARDLIPNSNPFLRHFFDHIIGPDFDKRLEFIVDELCQVFSHSDVEKLMSDFYKKSSKSNTTHDPVIHFYEDFLKEYDPDLRKSMGAYYTPTPVVRFMTRSVDFLLKKEFGLRGGLSDTTKLDDGKTHRVQILDPAVGTGTFISGVIREIYRTFKGQEGRWPKYVHNDLLPRIHGFELMMAPYTIAHLKLGMSFKETGFKYFNRRLGIYLTNSLEKSDDQEGLFTSFGLADSIAHESKEAQEIKNNKPIMVVIGNPPYNVSSNNRGEWIQNLIDDYKRNLNEKKINLDDDYIKFIRYAEHFIEKNNVGVVAYITNNSFIDGVTHRQMRKHLLETFDRIFILDLHGSTKKKETTSDGGKDQNVFSIQQGVSINIFVKKNKSKKTLGTVYHSEIFGDKKSKLSMLNDNAINTITWKKLTYSDPYFFFVPKDFENDADYKKGFRLDELFSEYNSGIKTDRDALFIDMDKSVLSKRIEKLLSGNYGSDFVNEFRIKNSSSYKIADRLKNKRFSEKYLKKILYRPFDFRWIYYDPTLISRPGSRAFSHIAHDENIALLTCRQQSTFPFQHALVTNILADICSVSLQTKETGYAFPLYLYDERGKTLNLNPNILKKIEKAVGQISEIDLFNYIYAVLNSQKFRSKYEEFLKIDFPRIPFPENKDTFSKLAKMGCKLQQIHLMNNKIPHTFKTIFPELGSDIVEIAPKYKNGMIFINETQYFGNIPESAWNFYIGGYQPAQKWLKDRKGISLSNDDIEHYQHIIAALVESQEIMKQIDQVIEL